jgi:hypothetical protein
MYLDRRNLLHWLVIALIIFLSVWLLTGRTSAQEATPAPDLVTVVTDTDEPVTVEPDTPIVIVRDQNPILLAALVVAGILIALLGGFVVVLARRGYEMLPEWAQDLVVYNRPQIEMRVDESFDTLDRMALLSPNTLDDLLVKYGREAVEGWVKDFYDKPTARDSPGSGLGA